MDDDVAKQLQQMGQAIRELNERVAKLERAQKKAESDARAASARLRHLR